MTGVPEVQIVPAIDLGGMAGSILALPVFIRQAVCGGVVTLELIPVLSRGTTLSSTGRSRPIEHSVPGEAGQFVTRDALGLSQESDAAIVAIAQKQRTLG